jgi:hypothetical protein
VLTVGAAVAASLVLTGAGQPPDETGKKYSQAKSELQSAGFLPVVSGTFGDEVGQSDCIVARQESTMASAFVGGGWKAPGSKPKVLLTLNCAPQKK